MPSVVLGCKNMDCTHGKNHAISRKIKAKSKKKKKKNGGQSSITESCNWIFTLLSQIFPEEVLFSYHLSFSLPLEIFFMKKVWNKLEIFFMRKVWNKPVNSFKMTNRITTERPKQNLWRNNHHSRKFDV